MTELLKIFSLGTSLVVWWLRLYLPTQGGVGLIPGQGAKIPYPHRQDKNQNIKQAIL